MAGDGRPSAHVAQAPLGRVCHTSRWLVADDHAGVGSVVHGLVFDHEASARSSGSAYIAAGGRSVERTLAVGALVALRPRGSTAVDSAETVANENKARRRRRLTLNGCAALRRRHKRKQLRDKRHLAVQQAAFPTRPLDTRIQLRAWRKCIAVGPRTLGTFRLVLLPGVVGLCVAVIPSVCPYADVRHNPAKAQTAVVRELPENQVVVEIACVLRIAI